MQAAPIPKGALRFAPVCYDRMRHAVHVPHYSDSRGVAGIFDSYEDAVQAVANSLADDPEHHMRWTDFTIIGHAAFSASVGVADYIRAFDSDGRAHIPCIISEERRAGPKTRHNCARFER
jgi:hypothetical protein